MAPPVFTEATLAEDTIVAMTTGESLSLACEALGKPEPEVTWLRNGVPFRTSAAAAAAAAGRKGGRGKKGRAVLGLENLRLSDSATYTCRAGNALGRADRNYTLKVEESSLHPRLPRGPDNTTVEAGATAVLECEVVSPTQPNIKWLRKLEDHADDDAGGGASGGGEVFNIGNDNKFRVLKTNSENIDKGGDVYLNRLAIADAGDADAGMYICFVTNSIGYKFKSSFVNVIRSEWKIIRYFLIF